MKSLSCILTGNREILAEIKPLDLKSVESARNA